MGIEDAWLPRLEELNMRAWHRGGKKFALKLLPSNRRARMLNEQFR